jgi:hypothetical protein
MAETAESDRRRWFRFSLRSLLAATVIFLLGVSHWNTSRELKTSREEVVQLRRKLGELVVGDPSRLHVVALRSPMTPYRAWQWRVHVPQGQRYRVTVELNDLTATFPGEPLHKTIPEKNEPILDAGDWTIVYEYDAQFRNSPGDVWKMAVRCTRPGTARTVHHTLGRPTLGWLDSDWVHNYQQLGIQETESFDVGETVDLLDVHAVPRQSWQGGLPTNSSKMKLRLTPMSTQP